MRAIAIAGFSGLSMIGAAASAAEPVDWAAAQPFAAISAHRLAAGEAPSFNGGDGLYVVEGRIVDALTGATLSRPRLITRPGVSASIEIGVDDRATMKMTVLIDEAGGHVDSTTEVRRGDEVISTSTSRSVIAPT